VVVNTCPLVEGMIMQVTEVYFRKKTKKLNSEDCDVSGYVLVMETLSDVTIS